MGLGRCWGRNDKIEVGIVCGCCRIREANGVGVHLCVLKKTWAWSRNDDIEMGL